MILEKTSLLTDTSIEMILEMFFQFFSNVDIKVVEILKKLI